MVSLIRQCLSNYYVCLHHVAHFHSFMVCDLFTTVFVRKIKTLSPPPLSFLPPGIYSGRKRVILLLLASKAKVNMQSAKGSTALMWAARRGDDDVVTELLGKKKDFKLSPLYHHICFCFKKFNRSALSIVV